MPETKPGYEQLLAENNALREENRLLRQRLVRLCKMTGSRRPEVGGELPDDDDFHIPYGSVSADADSAARRSAATVTQSSPADEKIDLFLSLFRGREDVYAKRWYSAKTEKSGYLPVCLHEWEHGLCDKRKQKCGVCPNRKLAPLDRAAVFAHLSERIYEA